MSQRGYGLTCSRPRRTKGWSLTSRLQQTSFALCALDIAVITSLLSQPREPRAYRRRRIINFGCRAPPSVVAVDGTECSKASGDEVNERTNPIGNEAPA